MLLYHRATQQQRFLLRLMTKEMTANARKHKHRGVLYVNGTFHQAREKVLVFFLMTHDENGKGISLSALLVAPEPKSRSASDSYDSHLLQKFREK